MALCTLLRQDTTNLAKYWIRGAESPRENQVTGFIQVFYIYVWAIALIVILGKLRRENRCNCLFVSLHCSESLSSF